MSGNPLAARATFVIVGLMMIALLTCRAIFGPVEA